MNAEHIGNRIEAVQKAMGEKESQIDSYEKERSSLSSQKEEALGRQTEAEVALMEKDTVISETEQQIEGLKQAVIATLNEKASINAKEQRYEAMLEQVNLRRAEVSQKLLKSKSDESVQEELIKEERTALDQISGEISQLKAREAEIEKQSAASAEKIRELGEKLQKPVYYVLNKTDEISRGVMTQAIRNPERILAVLPAAPELTAAALLGQKLVLESSALDQAAKKICGM